MNLPTDWQTPAALVVVAVTVVLLVLRYLRRRASKKGPGCGSSCACPVKPLDRTGDDESKR